MEVHVHVHMHGGRMDEKLDEILAAVSLLTSQGKVIMKEIDDLESAVMENTTVDESAVTLLTNMAATIESLKNDPAKLQQFANNIRASSAKLASAVQANTPADTGGGSTGSGDTGTGSGDTGTGDTGTGNTGTTGDTGGGS